MVQNSGKILSSFVGIFGSFGLGFEDSLVQSQEELWCSQNSHLSACSNFMLWVNFLAGMLNCNRCVKFRSLLLLERCEIHVKRNKIYVLWAILTCIIDALSNLVHAGEIRSGSTLAFHRV